MYPHLSTAEITALWPLVRISPDCWEWTGTKTIYGYGRIKRHKRQMFIHRVIWEIYFGPIPEGLFVCHHCDNPLCVRPDHLFLGTTLDNQRDKWSKGRGPTGDKHGTHTHPESVARGDQHPARQHPERMARGERHGNAKLTDDKVREIRAMIAAGQPIPSIARAFGVNDGTIWFIEQGRHWKHVT